MKRLQRYEEMLSLIYRLPEQLRDAWVIGCQCPVGKMRVVRNIVATGMGGSAIGGDLVRTVLLAETAVPVLVWRDYQLPGGVDKNTVVFASSYSGNTEETIAVYREARKRGAQIFVLTSGGKLAEMAQRDGVSLIIVPGGIPPRAAIGFMSVPILAVLNRLGLLRSYEQDIEETVSLLQARIDSWRRQAAVLSRLLFERIAIIYSTSRVLDWVAYRWQCQLNENAKVIAHSGCLPEQSHNEIMGFGAPAFINNKIFIIGLGDERTTHERTEIRFQNMLALIRGHIAGVRIFTTEGKSLLAKMFSLSVLGDLISVMLAKRRGVDPVSIPRIDELKLSLEKGKRQG